MTFLSMGDFLTASGAVSAGALLERFAMTGSLGAGHASEANRRAGRQYSQKGQG